MTSNIAIPQALIDALPEGVSATACEAARYGDLDAYADADIDLDAVVLITPGWRADDGNAPIDYPEAESAEDAAQDYADTGWNETTETLWIEVQTWRVGYVLDTDGDLAEIMIDHRNRTVTVEPEEPPCDHPDGHDWQSPIEIVGGIEENPGVWGHGGGVVIDEVCMRCGCRRRTDTWAQNPATGEQGLRSVEYTPGYYVDEIEEWIGERIGYDVRQDGRGGWETEIEIDEDDLGEHDPDDAESAALARDEAFDRKLAEINGDLPDGFYAEFTGDYSGDACDVCIEWVGE